MSSFHRWHKPNVSGLLIAVTSSVAAVCFSGNAPAFANDTVIYSSCKKDLQLSDSGCQCVLKEVHNTLTPNQREVFVAMIQGDNSAMIAAQSSGKFTGEDMTTLANFMTTTPNKCKTQ